MIRADAVDRIRARRAARPIRRVVPPALQPDGVRRAYFTALSQLLARFGAVLREKLGPVFEEAGREDAVRADAPPADDGAVAGAPPNLSPRIRAAIRETAEATANLFSQSELLKLGEKVGTHTSEFQKQQWIRQAKAVVGVDPTKSEPWLHGSIREFARLNAGLIKSVQFQALGDVEKHVTAAALGGARHETLAKMLKARLGVAESRAKLIARDQVGKFYGSLAATRQRAAGVTKYTWRTVRDNRVRDEHSERDGKVFLWSEPPEGGHPGEEIQCRCSAEPDLDELLRFEGGELPPEAPPAAAPAPPAATALAPAIEATPQALPVAPPAPAPADLAPPPAPPNAPPPQSYPPGDWPAKMPASQAHQWHGAGFVFDPATKKFTSPAGWTAGVPTKPTSAPPAKPPPKKKPKAPPALPLAPPAVLPPLAPPPAKFQLFGTPAQQAKQFDHVQKADPSGFYWHPSAGTWAKTPDPVYGPGGTHAGQAPPAFVFSAAGQQAAVAKGSSAGAPASGALYDGSHVPGADKYARLSSAGYDEHQEEFRTKWWPKLPKAEQEAVARYTGGDYHKLNQQLRGVRPWDKDGERFRDRLDEAYAKAPPLSKPVFAYRGMGAEILDEQIPGWRNLTPKDLVGAQLGSENFMSTSGVAGSEFPKELKLRIRLPQGCRRAAFIRDWSHFKNEDEVLLGRGSQLRIVNAEKVGSKMVLDVELVPKIPPDELGTSH